MQITTKMIKQIISEEVTKARKSKTKTISLSEDLVAQMVREELDAMLGEEDEAAKEKEQTGDVGVFAKKLQSSGLDEYVMKINKADELYGLISVILKTALESESPIGEKDIAAVLKEAMKGNWVSKEKKPEGDDQQGGDDGGEEQVKEGRYHRTPYQGDDPRAQAFDQAITILDDQVYDSLEDDVASYADDAVRALSKAIEELEYQRNTVGNLGDAEKRAIRDFEASQGKED